ncbi:MAG: hypothetical protein L6Q52_16645 [Rhodocyclaceae bacterium]|nr:hypothetical protein [Rhodocyclaceae bacterium]
MITGHRVKCSRRCNRATRVGMRGAGLVKALLLIPATLAVLLLLAVGFFEGRKAYWDYRVKGMCEKDGGIKVFESIAITHSQFLAWGGQDGIRGVPIPHESEKRTDIPVFRRTDDQVIHPGGPEVRRDMTEFVRRSDGKVLGKYVHYARRGGDFPNFAHESSFGCQVTSVISEKFILVEGGAK